MSTTIFVNGQDDGTLVEGNAPTEIVEGTNGVSLDMFFSRLEQGRVGLIRVRGDGITGVSSQAFLRDLNFFTVPDKPNEYFALLAVPSEQAIRSYDLNVVVDVDGAREPVVLQTEFAVDNGGFIRQPVTLPPDPRLEDLLNRDIEDAELATIFTVASEFTDGRLWDSRGFGAPLDSELTSPFGAVRVFNDSYDSVHTGWDYNAIIGQPMVASASGRVAFADYLPLRGNHVMINHGVGVYSGYAHMSVVFVTQGQHVEAGQVLGLVGSTGRSSSAHAHIEFIVNGHWVDAADFIEMPIP